MPRTEIQIMDGWKFALGKECPQKEAFQTVALPHDWAITMPIERDMAEGEPQGFYNRWSIGWYCKTIRLDEKKDGYCYCLSFDGIMENSTVWVNGQEAGGQRYGYSAFRLDVTQFVVPGDNEILIRVDNTVQRMRHLPHREMAGSAQGAFGSMGSGGDCSRLRTDHHSNRRKRAGDGHRSGTEQR